MASFLERAQAQRQTAADPEYQQLVLENEAVSRVEDRASSFLDRAKAKRDIPAAKVEPVVALSEPKPLDMTIAKDGRPQFIHDNNAKAKELADGYRELVEQPLSRERRDKEKVMMKDYITHVKQSRIQELSEALEVNQNASEGFGLRTIDDAVNTVAEAGLGLLAIGVGNEKAADYLAKKRSLRKEMNRLKNEKSYLGPTVGPLVGDVLSSVFSTTVAAATVGPMGIVAEVAAENYTDSMYKNKHLSPKRRVATATGSALIGGGLVWAGGAFAKRVGVASGEVIVPMAGKHTAGIVNSTIGRTVGGAIGRTGVGKAASGMLRNVEGKLASQAGKLSKMHQAAWIEGIEEGSDTGLQALNDAIIGKDEDALQGVGWNMLNNFALGAVMGPAAEVATKPGETMDAVTDAALELSPKVAHLKDLTTKWIERLPKKDPNNPDASLAESPETKTNTRDDQGHVVTQDGIPISRRALNDQLAALQGLEAEVEQQYQDGGARELDQITLDRTADVKSIQTEINDLKRQRAQWVSSGVAKDSSRVKNLDSRISILDANKKEVNSKLANNRVMQTEWKNEFEEVYKQEKAYLAQEFDRLTQLRELPDVATKVNDDLKKSDQKAEAATARAQKPGKPKTGEPNAKSDTKTDTGAESDASVDSIPIADTKAPEVDREGTPKDPIVSASEVFTKIHKEAMSAKQKDVQFMRKAFGLAKVDKRLKMSTEENFRLAEEQGIPDRAVELSREVLADPNRILTSVELAGVQMRYASEMRGMIQDIERVNNDPNISDAAYQAASDSIDARQNDFDAITDAWIQSSSEAGAALQAQQRIYGVLYSKERMLTKARRSKGEALTKEETSTVVAAAQEVERTQQVWDEVAKDHAKHTWEYDKAERDCVVAQCDAQSAARSMEPRNWLLNTIEKYNSIRMAMTLAGDLAALGRQGAVFTAGHPIKSMKLLPTFFKPMMSKNWENAETKAFRVERALKEHENYNVLTKEYDVPILDSSTRFREVETVGLARMRESFVGKGMISKVAGKVWKATPLANFDVAYRSWLNATRYTAANMTYEANKHLLKHSGGKRQMQTAIDVTMNGTGHSKHGLGVPGQMVMTAPRWMVSRMQWPARMQWHLAKGGIDIIRGKKSASTHLAKEYMRAVAGAVGISAILGGVASQMFGPENVEIYRNPMDPLFGYMQIRGEDGTETLIDISGGMAFAVRNAMKVLKGGHEFATGPNKERDMDIAKVVGGVLTSRGSPIARDVAYIGQVGKPTNENEVMSKAEYALRSATFLSWQGTFDAARTGGIKKAGFIGLMESFGSSTFDKD